NQDDMKHEKPEKCRKSREQATKYTGLEDLQSPGSTSSNQGINRLCTNRPARPRQGIQGGSGGQHIIDQQHIMPLQGLPHAKSTPHGLPASLPSQGFLSLFKPWLGHNDVQAS